MTPPSLVVPVDILNDLAASGLKPQDLRIRRLDSVERSATGCSEGARGYVIPYFAFSGNVLPFYRVKLIDPPDGVKYRQLRKSSNHLYFPIGLKYVLLDWLKANPEFPLIVITEGEKKATAAVKCGIPAIGLGGVDSWRSRTVVLPKDVELSKSERTGKVNARMPASNLNIPELLQLADGFGTLIDIITQYNLTPTIIYDSDTGGTVKSEVQRAATVLAYELRHLGVPSSRIRQVVLPDVFDGAPDSKTGLDDFLFSKSGQGGVDKLKPLLFEAFNDPTKFPRHPNPRGYIATQLDNNPGRKETQQIAGIVIAELDARGIRFREKHTGAPYYYDSISHRLIPATLLSRHGEVLHESKFGTLLYKEFGLAGVDSKVLSFLASQFTSEEPISEVVPRRIKCLITEKEDPTNPFGIAIQTSDSTFIAISPDPFNPIKLHTNGQLGILFEQDQVEPVDVDRVIEYFDEYLFESAGPLYPWWRVIIDDTNVGKSIMEAAREALEKEEAHPVSEDVKRQMGTLQDGNIEDVLPREIPDGMLIPSGKNMRSYATLLNYISPFLQKWRGTQLPVEIMVGEAGSGKSSLYEMRLSILTGRPRLRNLPNDARDWTASISNSGGLHVTDNVHFSNRQIKQHISDEVCRLITEPNPTVEMRKLFTTNELARVPVDVTFCFTAVQQPFQNPDLFSRAAVFHTCSLGKAPDGDWVAKQVEDYGGREAWLAHHLVFLHRFLKKAAEEWDTNYRTTHRLAHFEQCLTMAGQILGIETGFIGRAVSDSQHEALEEADWTLQGVKAYADHARFHDPYRPFTAKDIAEWLAVQDEFSDNTLATNTRKLGKYMSTHYTVITQIAGIRVGSMMANRQTFKIRPESIPVPKGP